MDPGRGDAGQGGRERKYTVSLGRRSASWYMVGGLRNPARNVGYSKYQEPLKVWVIKDRPSDSDVHCI